MCVGLRDGLSTVLLTALLTTSRRPKNDLQTSWRSSRRARDGRALETAGPSRRPLDGPLHVIETVLKTVLEMTSVFNRPRECPRDGPLDGLKTALEAAFEKIFQTAFQTALKTVRYDGNETVL
jgi:hypothetical protein